MLRLALRLTLLLLCALLPGRAWAAVDAPAEIRVTGVAAENRVKGLEAHFVYCTYRATLATSRLHLGNEPALRGKASAPLFRWKGRWWNDFGGPDGTYDMRARVWSPELGIFLSADAFAYHDARGTLWSWPNQNPLRYADPTGHFGSDESWDKTAATNSAMSQSERNGLAALGAASLAVGFVAAELGGAGLIAEAYGALNSSAYAGVAALIRAGPWGRLLAGILVPSLGNLSGGGGGSCSASKSPAEAEVTAEEIRQINRSLGGSTELTGSADTVIANMAYRDGATARAATAIRDIAGRHLFDDANKRTAQAVAERLLGPSADPSQIRSVIDRTATGELRTVEDIAAGLGP